MHEYSKIFFIFFVAMYVASCQKSTVEDVANSSRNSGKSTNSTTQEKQKPTTINTEGAASSSEEDEYSFGGGDIVVGGGGDVLPKVTVSYPKFTYNGGGSAEVSGVSETASLTHKLSTSMTETSLEVLTLLWDSNRKEGKEAVRTWNDKTIYKLVKPVAGSTSSSTISPENGRFLLFASEAVSNKGDRMTFNPPIPVFPIPTSASRYTEAIKAGAVRYKSSASGSKSFPITAVVTVNNVSAERYDVTLSFEIDEPANQKGLLYQAIPMFKTSAYGLDIKDKNLLSIAADTLAFNDQHKRTVTVRINYKMCEKEQSGKKEPFNGGCK